MIILLQLSHFSPFILLHPTHHLPSTFPRFSSCPWVIHISSFFKYILLIMLLQLSHLFLSTLHSPPTVFLPLSLCPWVVHISSLASTFPVLFLTSPCQFCTYHLCFLFPCLFPHSPPSPSPLITLLVISISVTLFLF